MIDHCGPGPFCCQSCANSDENPPITATFLVFAVLDRADENRPYLVHHRVIAVGQIAEGACRRGSR